jgi:hypothetical protein
MPRHGVPVGCRFTPMTSSADSMTGSSGPPVRNRLLVRNGLLLRSPLSSPQEPQKNRANGRWMKVPRLANRFHPLFCLVTAIGAQLPPAPCCASLPELPIWLKSFTERPVSRPPSARSAPRFSCRRHRRRTPWRDARVTSGPVLPPQPEHRSSRKGRPTRWSVWFQSRLFGNLIAGYRSMDPEIWDHIRSPISGHRKSGSPPTASG